MNAGATVLRFLPPLILTREQADVAIAATRDALEAGA
jgi:4-aminobutyrate aminotransferase-like enzyme